MIPPAERKEPRPLKFKNMIKDGGRKSGGNKTHTHKKTQQGFTIHLPTDVLEGDTFGETLHIDQLLSHNTIGYAGVCSQHSFLSMIFCL